MSRAGIKHARGFLRGCGGWGVPIANLYRESEALGAWKAVPLLPETGGFRELNHSRQSPDFLSLRAGGGEVPSNAGYPWEVSHALHAVKGQAAKSLRIGRIDLRIQYCLLLFTHVDERKMVLYFPSVGPEYLSSGRFNC